MRLTATTIRSIALVPGQREKTFFDDEIPGFGLRIRATGARTWIVQYNVGRKTRRMSLGSPAMLDPGKARLTAKDLLAAVRLGRDPAGEKLEQQEKAAETFGRHLPQFLASKRADLKPQSFTPIDRFLSVYAQPWHGRALDGIDRRVVAIRLSEITTKHGPGAANRFRSALSDYFTWLIGAGLVESNPVTGTNKAPGEGGARTRLLDDGELAAIWRAAGIGQFGSIVMLLMLTGARREEIGGLRWSEIDLDRAVIMLPGERTKNSREHIVTLSPAAISILEAQPRRLDRGGAPRDLVFGHGMRAYSGWSKSRRELDARLEAAGTPVPDFVLHDFRRALSTWLHEAGFPPHVVERLLGHLQPGIGRVYNSAEHLAERRRALKKWADHIEEITAGKPPATIVRLRK